MSPTSSTRKRTERPLRILNAAALLMARYGYDKTTMDDIAREAGVSKGALYLVWPGKASLFDALLKHEMKRLVLDLRRRVEADPQGGMIANLYGHTLQALQNKPLICALYTRDVRILGDFIHRQDTQRYTRRLMLSKEVIGQMQAAGLLRCDIRPELMAYLFSLIAVGFMSIRGILPAEEAPSMPESIAAMNAMIQRGLALPGGDSLVAKESALKILDFMLSEDDRSLVTD